jgi:hypothetical protein
MKILIDPMLAILANDLSVNDKAELLMCILEYPHRDCSLGLWKYVKQQIDADAQKYREKCERMAENAKSRWSMKSNPKSDMTSGVIQGKEEKENVIKNYCKEKVGGNAHKNVENSVDKFFISEQFSFNAICKFHPAFANFISCYPEIVIERAQRAIIQNCKNQSLTLGTITKWIISKNDFYIKDQRGEK